MPPKPPFTSLLVRHRLPPLNHESSAASAPSSSSNKLAQILNAGAPATKHSPLMIKPISAAQKKFITKPFTPLSTSSSTSSSNKLVVAASSKPPPKRRDIHAPDFSYKVNYPIQPSPGADIVPPDQSALVPTNIDMKKYATSVDSRNFLTVYEYQLNNQWIIWDYHTGYVHLTGIWKAIGHNKADIVKLIENSPHLEPVIKRVRGGFLKIQGTWVPFEIAKALAARTCYYIRYALVPVFGADFPDTCLKPDEPGFGQLQLRFVPSTGKRRRRKRKELESSTPITAGVSTGFGATNHYEEDGDELMSPRKRTKSESGPKPVFPAGSRSSSGESSRADSLLLSDVVRSMVSPTMVHDTPTNLFYTSPQAVPLTQFPGSSRSHQNSIVSSASEEEEDEMNPLMSTSPFQADTQRELYQVLQATRSLQQMSMLNSSSQSHSMSAISADRSSITASYPKGFEFAGKLWKWDGHEKLNVVGNVERKVLLPRLGSVPNAFRVPPPSAGHASGNSFSKMDIKRLLC
ncbi:hypothetical protein DV495_001045 [Geotrichum candidum]|uniref:HTH APSES-type domain-containing protein n=1 Tax=Geotrichum candidum TaxID=1173061 RepID=A0A0J9XAG0_GEOCN|nr:hypothetical protein DV452_003477 [Geotrichum candidum]KAI9213223.1 hypothetical protein DS838_001867 [Geotrichum bryndzae]KAF5119018.1 hypothetical protein DV454_000120 [Geotrichum candidum]KAF5132697.1 hypothetical protein DV495_001045 [Geotrichum candidum]KAF7499625.1 hypothetical protein DV113_002301 [Geotrichum candidum]